jgi:hypothetical protein
LKSKKKEKKENGELKKNLEAKSKKEIEELKKDLEAKSKKENEELKNIRKNIIKKKLLKKCRTTFYNMWIYNIYRRCNN